MPLFPSQCDQHRNLSPGLPALRPGKCSLLCCLYSGSPHSAEAACLWVWMRYLIAPLKWLIFDLPIREIAIPGRIVDQGCAWHVLRQPALDHIGRQSKTSTDSELHREVLGKALAILANCINPVFRGRISIQHRSMNAMGQLSPAAINIAAWAAWGGLGYWQSTSRNNCNSVAQGGYIFRFVGGGGCHIACDSCELSSV